MLRGVRDVLTPRFLLAAAAAAVVAAVLGAMTAIAVIGVPASAADRDVLANIEASRTTGPASVDDRTDADVDRRTRPSPRLLPARHHPPAEPALPTTTSPEGWLVAGGTSSDPVDRGGPTVRWTLEVEPSTGLDVASVLEVAETALHDPRSWARDHALVRVDDPATADVRVVLATPPTVDGVCARVGLVTNGIFSCWSRGIAAVNLMRWTEGTREIDDLGLYRLYVVNHEVGHGLGHGHRSCGGSGQLAPVMQQQTRTLAGCVANPWPHPDG